MHNRGGAHPVEVIGAGRFQIRVLGGDQTDDALAGGGVVDQFDGARLAHRQRHGGQRIDHQPAQRQDGQGVRDIGERLARAITVSGLSVADFVDVDGLELLVG